MFTTRSIPKASTVPSGEIVFDENAVIFFVPVPSSLLHGVIPVGGPDGVGPKPHDFTSVVDPLGRTG